MKFSSRHLSNGKAYFFMALTGHLMIRGFFRKIYLFNRAGLPVGKPVLLAANHPTAFSEPILFGILLDPPLYYMTRGDVFKKPLYRKMMMSINMFPVYRVRDGYTGRDRNDGVFEYCENLLVQNKAITIFVEGEHHLEKRVRPLQKGIGRIAFDVYDKHRLEGLQVIPVGTSFRYGDQPRDDAMLQVGEPIYIRDYWEEYQQNPAAAMLRLTTDIETALKKLCLHLDDPADADLLEELLTLHRSDHPERILPIVEHHGKRFDGEKSVCDLLNALPSDKKQQLGALTSGYFRALKSAGLTDEGLMQPKQGAWWLILLFLLGFPFYLTGFVSSYPLIAAAKYLADQNVKKREFYSSVRMGAGFFLGMPYYLILLLISLAIWNPWLIALALTLPALGWFAMVYREQWQLWRAARRGLRYPERDRLLQMRRQIQEAW